ncbi:hypothetical protein [Plastoroseomonas hellenica]|uniref:hypothetical protein n=1 Tax=Plastoroseomonas hellenica TaxID=2687306 RepID=UPI001BAE0C77|nr:hypothetical protein [Plastoroseomonas hellenica]MBR0641275.1 hypothetical protein [Plastoroseomonas hellenica]
MAKQESRFATAQSTRHSRILVMFEDPNWILIRGENQQRAYATKEAALDAAAALATDSSALGCAIQVFLLEDDDIIPLPLKSGAAFGYGLHFGYRC